MFLLKSKRRDVFGDRREITADQNILSMTQEQRDRMAHSCWRISSSLPNRPQVIDAEATDVVESYG